MLSVPLVRTNSLLGYFTLTWAATIILLVHNVKRVRKVKFWVPVSAPLIYFLNFYLSIHQIINPYRPKITPKVASTRSIDRLELDLAGSRQKPYIFTTAVAFDVV